MRYIILTLFSIIDFNNIHNFFQSKFETYALEIDYITQEIKYMLMHIKEWSATEKVIIIYIISLLKAIF